jgi:hypothetical protein
LINRDIQASAEVAELIGAEDLARLRTGAAFGPFRCWRCCAHGDASQEPATVVAERYRLITRVTLAHPRCAPSQVVHIDADGPPGMYGPQEMVAITGILPLGGLKVPVLVLELLTETSARAPGSGDRVDLLAGHLLASGWALMRSLDQRPGYPPGWHLRASAPGRLLLADEPSGEVMFDGECGCPSPWRDLVGEWGYCVVLAGSVGLYALGGCQPDVGELTSMLTRAAAAGELLGVVAAFTAG